MYLFTAIIVLLICLGISAWLLKKHFAILVSKYNPRGYGGPKPQEEIKSSIGAFIVASFVIALGWPLLVPVVVLGVIGYYAWLKAVAWVTKQPEVKPE